MVEEKQEGGRILPPPPGKIGLSYGSQTLRLLVFTFLPQSEKILAKSIGQGVVTVIFQTRGHEELET